MATVLRLFVAAVILLLLARAVPVAWANRRLAFAVWRRIRLHHVLGCLGLLAVVAAVATTLMVLVPVTGHGIGSAIGLSGNAVFAPLEEAQLRANGGVAGTSAASPGDVPGSVPWGLVLFTTGFLALLLVLFPWLAYVEERVFRVGLEEAGLGRQSLRALWFGLVHLVMLIPLAAALAIAVAGFAYGRIYRRAYRRAAPRSPLVIGSFGLPVRVPVPPAQARAEAVLASTVWHTTFNSIVVLLVYALLVTEWVR